MKATIYHRMIARTIILFTALMTTALEGYSQNTFLKTIGGKRPDEMHQMIRSHDGGFVMAGNTESYGQGNFGATDNYVVKTDSDGNVLWSKTLGLQSYDDIYWIEPANDSGYVICGIASDNNTYIGILLVKISENGSVVWQKVLEQDHAGIGYCVRQTNDGGFIVAAEILQLDNLDFLLMKTDASGNVQWSKQLGSADADIPGYVMQTADGGYLITGTSRQNSATIPLYDIKTDSDGNVVWQKTYNTSPVFSRTTVSNVIATADGGYVIAGGNTHNQLFSDIMLLKINSTGDPQWVKAYGGGTDEYCGNMIQNNDGSFVVCGSSSSSEADNSDALVMLIDSSGNLMQSALFGKTTADDDFVSVLPLSDGYILGGNTSSFNQLQYSDFMLMRITKDFNGPQCDSLSPSIFETSFFFTDTTDVTSTDVTVLSNDVAAFTASGAKDSLQCNVATGGVLSSPPPHNAINFYPNPVTDQLTIETPSFTSGELVVTDVTGQSIYRLKLSANKTLIDVSRLSQGVYFVTLKSNSGILMSTFLKQ